MATNISLATPLPLSLDGDEVFDVPADTQEALDALYRLALMAPPMLEADALGSEE